MFTSLWNSYVLLALIALLPGTVSGAYRAASSSKPNGPQATRVLRDVSATYGEPQAP